MGNGIDALHGRTDVRFRSSKARRAGFREGWFVRLCICLGSKGRGKKDGRCHYDGDAMHLTELSQQPD